MRLILIPILFFAAIVSSTGTQAANLRLSWIDTSDNETGFKIERLSGETFSEIARVGANITSYTDSGLTDGAIYCYQVSAFNSAGSSAPSNQACATTSYSVENTVALTQGETTPGSASSSSNELLSTKLGELWADYRVTLKIKSSDDDAIGVMFRYIDKNNYYRFSWNTQERSRRLEKFENGVRTVLAEDAVPYSAGRTYDLEILAQGAALQVRIDGALIFSASDPTFDKGTIALYSRYNYGAFFDDVLVEGLTTGVVLLWDDFEDDDFTGWTIIDDVGTTDGPSEWSAKSGALAQSSNIGSNGKGKLGTFALYTARDWTDYRVTMKIKSTDDDSIGLMFRYLDNNNYYRFSWDRQRKFRRLEKIENGELKVLAGDSMAYVSGRIYSLEIIARGASLQVRIDGAPVFSATDPTFEKGTIALYSWYDRGAFFDDVLVEDLLTGDPLLWDNFGDNDFIGWTIIDDAGTTEGPSAWSANSGALVQTSNIGSNTTGRLGSFALY